MAIKTRSIDDSSEVAAEAVDVSADDSDLSTASLPIAIGDPAVPKEIPVSNLLEYIYDRIASFIAGGTGVSVSHDDATNTLTIASTSSASPRTDEEIRDVVAAFVDAGTNITVTHNDETDDLTIASAAPSGSWLLDRRSSPLDEDDTYLAANSAGRVYPLAFALTGGTWQTITLISRGFQGSSDGDIGWSYGASTFPRALFAAGGDRLRQDNLDNSLVIITYEDALNVRIRALSAGSGLNEAQFVGLFVQ